MDLAALRKNLSATKAQPLGRIMESKRAAVVTLRWLLVIAAGYLMLFSGPTWPKTSVSMVVVLLMVSNVAIGRLPHEFVEHAGFDVLLLLVDTTLLSVGFYLSEAVTSDFYLLYFFIVFLAGVSENLRSVLMGSVLASSAYLGLAWSEKTILPSQALQMSLPLRVFFIFAVSLFYGFLVERIRLDREARQVEYVTQLEGVNAKLRELVALRQEFLGTVSHELRTPLNAMLGYIDLLREGTVGDVKGPVWAYVDKAYRRGRHLMQLIEELLTFSDLSKGRTSIDLQRVDVAGMLKKIEISVLPPAKAKGLDLRIQVAPDVGQIETDANKVIQIVLHLVANAIKFTESGEIAIRADRYNGTLSNGWHGNIVQLQVRDTGPGIPPEAQQVMFEEFRQLDGSATRRHEGMGLGLSVCRGLVHLLRGDIQIESELGRGTTFSVRLPEQKAESDWTATPLLSRSGDGAMSRQTVELITPSHPFKRIANGSKGQAA